MRKHQGATRRATVGAALVVAAAVTVLTANPAAADPVGAGEASAFGGTVSVAGQEVVPPTPTASATLPADVDETTVDLPASPVAVSGTLNAAAAVSAESELTSALDVATQQVAGPYNAVATGSIEEADVLVDVVGEGVSLLSADAIRAEAVGVCVGGTVQYSATSEVINLDVGGQDLPLNAPLEQILDAVSDLLEQTTLDQVVDIERNVVTELEDGIAVDALVVTVLAVAGDPVAEVRLGHAEVSGLTCGPTGPECSDGVDNDGDGGIDFEAPEGATPDPDCDGPDDSETPECSNGIDDDGDGRIDFGTAATNDPGCSSVDDDDESDDPALPGSPNDGGQAPTRLPTTGGDATTTAGIAAAMGAGALGLAALRRRLA